MTISQDREWHFRRVLLQIIFLGLLAGSSSTIYAGCRGAAPVSLERTTTLRNLLSPATASGDFRVHAETRSADQQTYFVLYSITETNDSGTHILYLAAISMNPQPRILSALDVSSYLSLFARGVLSQPDASLLVAPRVAESTTDIDGCLNAFVLRPDLQAVHMNVFARPQRQQGEGANDVVFALLDHTSLRPVLELNRSSWHDKRLHQDSVIAVLPSTAMVTDLIWWQSSEQSGGIMADATFDQNKWYRWNGNGFEKVGTLEPADLADRLRSAFRLTRSDQISTVEMKLLIKGSEHSAQ